MLRYIRGGVDGRVLHEPTQEDLDRIVDSATAAEWTGLEGNPREGISALGSWMEHMGAKATTKRCLVAAIPPHNYIALLEILRIPRGDGD